MNHVRHLNGILKGQKGRKVTEICQRKGLGRRKVANVGRGIRENKVRSGWMTG